ncbi:MAG: hypothetical protein E6H08_06590 [Bacteroidetes bacterium]|nr:MAG: hypothetical protein E6H08_06590 [Bacteroidota bacterium]
MKFIATLLSITLLVASAYSKETNYTASTPADPIVRTFLGISLTDSIDFIRWKLSITGNKYSVGCGYGIGKPNTNGFYDEKKVILNGIVRKENNIYILENKDHVLRLAELNANLLHIVNNDNTLLIGGGGWSYVLNNTEPIPTDQSNFIAKQSVLRDSIAFQGRTPCGVPHIIQPGKECYKLKWYLVLYYNKKNKQATYRILGTPYRGDEGGKRGSWKTISGKEGRIIYQLNDANEAPFIYLLKLDEGVLIFTDSKGNLLVGDHDFSYTLNRRF